MSKVHNKYTFFSLRIQRSKQRDQMTHHKCNSCQGPIVFLQTDARPALGLSIEGKDCGPTTILKRQGHSRRTDSLSQVSVLMHSTGAWDPASARKLSKQENKRELTEICLTILKEDRKVIQGGRTTFQQMLQRNTIIQPKDREFQLNCNSN